MLRKNNSYAINIEGITFWRKIIDGEGNELYVKDKLEEDYNLYIDKVKDDNYLDWVTGRVFKMTDIGDDLLVIPSEIKVSKSVVTKCYDVTSIAALLLENNEEEYTNISEGFLYDTYFCQKISSKYGLDVIPATFVYEEIRNTRKKYIANNDKDNVKCKTLNRKRQKYQVK